LRVCEPVGCVLYADGLCFFFLIRVLEDAAGAPPKSPEPFKP
jgi:hypothetical protein